MKTTIFTVHKGRLNIKASVVYMSCCPTAPETYRTGQKKKKLIHAVCNATLFMSLQNK